MRLHQITTSVDRPAMDVRQTLILTGNEVAAHFGWMAMFADMDMPASSAITRNEAGVDAGRPRADRQSG
jgi:hypothetical protein